MKNYYEDRIRILEEILRLVPAAPSMSFHHGTQNETPESLLRLFRYELEMSQWRLIRREYYKEKKRQRRWQIANQKILDKIHEIQNNPPKSKCNGKFTNIFTSWKESWKIK